MFKKTGLFRGIACLSVFFLLISILAGVLLEDNVVMVDQNLGTHSRKTITTDDGTLYSDYIPTDFMTDGKLDAEKAAAASKSFNTKVGEEGVVLLKNENSALPFSGVKKISALGFYSNKVGVKGGGYGAPAASKFDAVLAEYGIELNPIVKEAYAGVKGGSYPSPGYANNKRWGKITDDEYYASESDIIFKSHEPTVDELMGVNGSFVSSLNDYNDAAIVCFGRASAEGADYLAGPSGVEASSGARTALGLTDGERSILRLAEEKFDRVIVFINSTNTMEIDELKKDAKVDAIIYMPNLLELNLYGLCNVLTGKTSPSGGLNNIYASNTLSSPAMMNIGFYRYTNASDVKIYKTKEAYDAANATYGRIDTSTLGTNGTDVGYTNYLIEAEGIYVGYRYYETRYYDCVMGQGNAKSKVGVYDSKNNWEYSEEVTYGFGYGLTYTTFDYEMGNVTFDFEGTHVKNHEVYANVPVTVKNTGSVASKTSVQIYAQAPYTDYDKQNGVEKSAVTLVAYQKTDVIKPGESVTINVVVDLADVASYDCNNMKTYIMEESDSYYFAVGNGAHDALNNILAAEGKTTANGMDYNGKAAAAKKWSYNSVTDNAVDNFTFSVSKSGEKISNLFDSSRWEYYGEKNVVTYLTRNDWSGTYPKSYTGLTANSTMLKYLNGEVIETKDKANPSTSEELAAVKWNQGTELKFSDMKGAAYDDYRWEELLDNVKLEEAIQFCFKGGRVFADLESVGFPTGNYAENSASKNLKWNAEGTNPPWINEDNSANATITFPDYAIMACTFSHEIAAEYGKLLGIGSLLAEKMYIWAPGANTLRTPYNGRSAQYYSEDPVLTGVNTMEAAVAALEYGGIVTAKHFAFNDQELGRSGIAPFMTEQRAREVELRAFQIAVEANAYDTKENDTGMIGMMTSFSKLGAIDCTVNKNLLTGLVQGEWGYHGYVVSDLKDDLDLAPQAFLAGLTGYDYRNAADDVDPYANNEEFFYDANVQIAMKEMMHRELYCFANSNLMNKINSSSYTIWNMTWWRQVYIAGISVFGVLFLASTALFAVSVVKNKKEEN